jgi:hypothetical protein
LAQLRQALRILGQRNSSLYVGSLVWYRKLRQTDIAEESISMLFLLLSIWLLVSVTKEK